MSVRRYDFIELTAEVSPEGWIRDRPVVTRAGIFEYARADGKILCEYRSPDEVFRTDSLASLKGVPVTDGHTGVVDKSNVSGIIGTVLTAGERSNDNVVADLVIYDTARLGTKRELSLGYSCDVVEEPGEYAGRHYDTIQRNIIYNHLACVRRGRAGNARLRLDHADDAAQGQFELDRDHEERRNKGMSENNNSKLVTVRVDEIEYEAPPEIARALKRAEEEVKATRDELKQARSGTVELQKRYEAQEAEMQKRYDGLEAERDALKARAGEHAKELQDVRETARVGLRERLRIEEIGRELSVEDKILNDGTDLDIKRAVMGKLRPTFKLEGKSEDYIASAFDMAVDDEAAKARRVQEQRAKIEGTGSGHREPVLSLSADSARQKMIERLRQPNPRLTTKSTSAS